MAEIVVLGGGPAGTAAATRAAQLGAHVTLVEKALIGGNCVNYNCIPLAGMMASAALLDRMRRAEVLGVEAPAPSLNMHKVRERVAGIVTELREGTVGLLGSFGIELVTGEGRLAGPCSVTAGGKTYTADAIILAAGARETSPPFVAHAMLTPRQALELEYPPARLLVLGGAAVEVELAQYFALLGSQVTLATPDPLILAGEDYELSQRLQTIMATQGVRILTGARVTEMTPEEDGVAAIIQQRKGEIRVSAERWLWAGVAPNVEGLGLETAGVAVEDGVVKADAACRTNVPTIYAVGDLAGEPFYSCVATVQGMAAAENALGNNRRVDLKALPRCLYTIPEAASVGLSEDQAEDRGYQVEIANISLSTSARAMTLDEAAGGIKMVFDGRRRRLLGVHIVGTRATDLIGEAALAIQLEALADDFAWALRGHPTLGESMLEAGRAFFGQALYIPKW